jgi:hypothetical protein
MARGQRLDELIKQKNKEIEKLRSKVLDLENHGLNKYIKHKCRCEICRAAKAESMRRYNQKKRVANAKD